MIAFPLYILLFIYLVYLVVFIIFSLLNFYHIMDSVSFDSVSFTMSFFVLISSILILFFTFSALAKLGINWKYMVVLFGGS
ncbi:MAG: hypothetical protein CL685_01410 [Candidatus Magasanikbacteria bacterium]|nr:hypothetical protein [Candidatus Magasanikbacteria bacterium]